MKQKLKALPLSDIRIQDAFWSRYIDLAENTMIPYQWEVLNDRVNGAAKSHCIENFKIAAGESEGSYYGMVFQDTDVAKWLEAVAYSLMHKRNPQLEETVDEVIALMGRAQHKDGYLNTYYTIKEKGKRWSNLWQGHELYTAGHMIEAAVAYYTATGKRAFLDIVCHMADLICDTFGSGDGKSPGYPGHPEIELALVRLYHVTDNKRYLDTAKFFVDVRGTSDPHYYDVERSKPGFHHIFPEFGHLGYDNVVAHKPVRSQQEAIGHAVRACYLYAGMADISYEYQDETLLDTCRTLFDNIVQKQMFITGGIGAAADGECFTCDYDLPSNYNYSETCASVGLSLFSLRMMQIEHDGRYADTFERALYNNVLAGMALTGKEFFYVNPLEVVPEQLKANRTLHHVLPQRRPWMGVACCPPNIARTLTALGQYIYAADDDTLFVNLFIANEASVCLNGMQLALKLETQYPYDNQMRLKVSGDGKTKATISIREPGWGNIQSVLIDGKQALCKRKKGYLYVTQMFTPDSVIEWTIDMEPTLLYAHPRVRSAAGKVAIQRGPLVYCLEEADNGKNLGAIAIAPDATLKVVPSKWSGGKYAVEVSGYRISEQGWGETLYRPCGQQTEPCTLHAIPYCLWNNRGVGEMIIWMQQHRGR